MEEDPVGEREHDPDADAVEGAAPAGGHAEGDGQQRHHDGDEGEGEFALEFDGERDDVDAAGREFGDVGRSSGTVMSSAIGVSVPK